MACSIDDIVIDDGFAKLNRRLSEDEWQQLLISIGRDGFLHPLVVWLNQNILLDGHHRYELWQTVYSDDETAQPPVIIEKHFDCREDAERWAVTFQRARRNLGLFESVEQALKSDEASKAKERAKANEKKRKGKQSGASCQNSDNLIQPVDTKKEIAAIAGVSHDTVSRVKAIVEHADAETVAKARAGEMSVNEAYRRARKSDPAKRNGETPPKPITLNRALENLQSKLNELKERWPEGHLAVMGHHLVHAGNEILQEATNGCV